VKIEVRRMNGATWVRLDKDLAIVPIYLLDEIRADWANNLADAVKHEEVVVNLWGKGID